MLLSFKQNRLNHIGSEGSASIASSLSQNIDFFFDNRIHKAFSQFTTLNVKGLASTPDYLAFALCMAATRTTVEIAQSESFRGF